MADNKENSSQSSQTPKKGAVPRISPEVAKAIAVSFSGRRVSKASSKALGTNAPVQKPAAGAEAAAQLLFGVPGDGSDYVSRNGLHMNLRPAVPTGAVLPAGGKIPLRVAFAGGGTGGHLYPALAVANELKNCGADMLFFEASQGVGCSIIPRSGYKVVPIWAHGLSGSIFEKIAAVFRMGVGFVQSLIRLAEFAPQVLIASGGYVCAPVALAAKVLGIPVILLEQNAFAGKSARLIAQFASCVCVSWPGEYKSLPREKLLLTGNPIRSAIVSCNAEEARAKLKIPAGKRCFAVIGGSQGAASLNKAVLSLLPRLAGKDMTLIHLTGEKNYDEVTSRSSELVADAKLDYRPMAYCDDMASLYAACDMVVCRAGATTLSEIAARGVPSILVPYPYAAENHQEANARILESHGAAMVILDKQVETDLEPALLELIDDEAKLKAMGGAARTLGRPEAAAVVTGLALKLAFKR